MNTVVKLTVGASIIGLVFLAYRAIKNAMANFDVQVVGYGTPTISNLSVTVPIQLQFTNPTPLPISLDKILADVYIKKNDQFIKAATVNQSIKIAPGKTTQVLYPVLDLKSIFGGNIFNTFTSLTSIIGSKKLLVRADVKAIYNGVALPVQTITEEMPLT